MSVMRQRGGPPGSSSVDPQQTDEEGAAPEIVQCWACHAWLQPPQGAPLVLCGVEGCGAIVRVRPANSANMHSWPLRFVMRLPILLTVLLVGVTVVGGLGLMLPWYLRGIHAPLWLAACHWAFALFLTGNVVYNFIVSTVIDPGYTRAFPPASRPVETLGDNVSMCQWCDHCSAPRPPGCSHSRQEGRCVLGLDHFCLFIGQSVGARNHRFFLLFVFYVLLSVTYILVAVAHGAWAIPDLELEEYARQRGIDPSDVKDSWLRGFSMSATDKSLPLRLRGIAMVLKTPARRYGMGGFFNEGAATGVCLMFNVMLDIALFLGLLFLGGSALWDLSRGETALQRWKRARNEQAMARVSLRGADQARSGDENDGGQSSAPSSGRDSPAPNQGSWLARLAKGSQRVFGSARLPWLLLPAFPARRPDDPLREWRQLADRGFSFYE